MVALLATGGLAATAPALAQVAGGTTAVDMNVTESIDFAMGWSAKRSLLGKVDDLIIAPDEKVSYAIVGAGAAATEAEASISQQLTA